jgi:hypothetical protein
MNGVFLLKNSCEIAVFIPFIEFFSAGICDCLTGRQEVVFKKYLSLRLKKK